MQYELGRRKDNLSTRIFKSTNEIILFVGFFICPPLFVVVFNYIVVFNYVSESDSVSVFVPSLSL